MTPPTNGGGTHRGGARYATAVIALGSNLGDRQATLEHAVAALDALPDSTVIAVSSWHGTVALTLEGPDPERPAYLNGVVLLQTRLDPYTLLEAMRAIEMANGRERNQQWGDRTLDLDLIALDALEIDSSVLQVPHPRAHERDFVLSPWFEVQPDAELPGHGPIAALLAALTVPTPVEKDDDPPASHPGAMP